MAEGTPFWRRGNMWAGFATTVTDVSAPTAAEVAAADEITVDLASIEGLGAENQPIDAPNLKSAAQRQIPGPIQLNAGTLTIYDYQGGAAENPLLTSLAIGTQGYLIIGPYDTATPVAGDVVEVWPIEVASMQRPYGTDAVGATWQCKVTVTNEPDQNAIVAA